MADDPVAGVEALSISEDNLGAVLKTVGSPPDGDHFLRAHQVSRILGALHENVLWKSEADLWVLINTIRSDFRPEEIAVQGLEPISLVIHRLADHCQGLKGRLNEEGRDEKNEEGRDEKNEEGRDEKNEEGRDEKNEEGRDEKTRGWICQQLTGFIDALRTSGWESTNASIMIWRDTVNSEHYPKMLEFKCTCNRTGYVEVELTPARLADLQHNTTATRLVQILNLEANNKDHRFIISRNRSAKKELLADIGPVGFVYCSVQFNKTEIKALDGTSIMGPLEQRYGGCALTFTNALQGTSWKPEDYNFYKMGSKFYSREWSQLILVERKGCNEGTARKWKLVDEVSKEVHTVNAEEGPGWPWILKYCGRANYGCFAWTHPTLVFPEPLRLDKINCTFGPHQCIANRRCLECRIALERKGNVKATKVSPSTSDELVPLSIPGPANELFVKNTYKVKPIVSLFVFALSVPPHQRLVLEQMQAGEKVFDDVQFKKIQDNWKLEEAENCHYVAWTTSF
jgi:hypothetical protein